jgi:hypothetical protein
VSALAPEPEHMFASARGGSRPMPARVVQQTNATADGLDRPDSPSLSQGPEKSVTFDLNPMGPSREASPEKDMERDGEEEGRRHRRRHIDDERSDSTRESGRHRKRHHGWE